MGLARPARLIRLAAPALLCAAALAAGRCGAPADPPNVLVLVMDTTRGDRGDGSEAARRVTPALDRLAASGVRYDDAWSPAGWTLPAHASLFTGLRPERHLAEVGLRSYLGPEHPTLASILRGAGWETGCFTNNGHVAPAYGLDRGFDRFEPLFSRPDRTYPWAPETHAAAAEWVREVVARGRRFLLFVNDMEPHLPYTPPPDAARRFLPPDATADEIAWGRSFDAVAGLPYTVGERELTPRQRTILAALYDAEVATLDAAVGDFLGGLARDGVLDRTLVVVTSDHGENLGDHGFVDHSLSMHRSICRVPLVLRLPGAFEGGRTVRDVVRLEDVLPTVLEVCGVEAPAGIDGRSFAGGAAGRVSLGTMAGSAVQRTRLAENLPGARTDRMRDWRTAYDGRFHYLRASDGREELYDVAADPEEVRDLTPAGGLELERMRALVPR